MSTKFIEDLYRLEKLDLHFSDAFATRIMLIVQNKVREVSANEDFKDWSFDYVVGLNNNHKPFVNGVTDEH